VSITSCRHPAETVSRPHSRRVLTRRNSRVAILIRLHQPPLAGDAVSGRAKAVPGRTRHTCGILTTPAARKLLRARIPARLLRSVRRKSCATW
jgi:hypothetical protein